MKIAFLALLLMNFGAVTSTLEWTEYENINCTGAITSLRKILIEASKCIALPDKCMKNNHGFPSSRRQCMAKDAHGLSSKTNR
jgi:hypothetical protein